MIGRNEKWGKIYTEHALKAIVSHNFEKIMSPKFHENRMTGGQMRGGKRLAKKNERGSQK